MTKSKVGVGEHYFSSMPKSDVNYNLVRASFLGRSFEFVTASSVFSKRRVDMGTRLLIESMSLPESGLVLDMGCGYGVVGIVAAAFNAKLQVYMSDVNVRAVSLAKKNALRNRVSNTYVRCGFLYEPIEGLKFDCILSNPPISAGMGIVRAMVMEAPRFMLPNATFEMVIRSKIGVKVFPSLFKEVFGNCVITARGSGFRVLSGKHQP